MANGTVIKSMVASSDALIAHAKQEFGDYLLFELTGRDYDKPRTSYIVSINAFGFAFDIVYEFETEQVIVYDFERGVDVMSRDVSADDDVSELFDGLYFYTLWLHHCDSTNGYEIL